MHGTHTEVAVANALAAASAEEQRARSAQSERVHPAEIAHAALLRVRADPDSTSFIKAVVVAGEHDPIPYRDLADGSDRRIVCIDLTDGGTVWCEELDGEPRWLPEAEFQLHDVGFDHVGFDDGGFDDGGFDDVGFDDVAAVISPGAIALMILGVVVLAVGVIVALSLAILPSGR
jgi:hypothetical protein